MGFHTECLVCWLSPTFSALFNSCDCSRPTFPSFSPPLPFSSLSPPPLLQHAFSLKERIERVECGAHFVLLLTSSGKIMSFGDNCYGQTGLGKERTFVCHPEHVSLGENQSESVVDLSAGHAHSLCVTQEGGVFSWGWNLDGQCSFPPNNEKLFSPQQVTFPSPANEENEKNQTTSCLVAKKVSGGFSHSLVLLEDHHKNSTVIVFGSNKYGECGSSPSLSPPSLPPSILLLPLHSQDQPQQPQQPQQQERITNVIAGDRSSFLQLSSGKLLSFGQNNFGQLGLSSQELVSWEPRIASDVVDAELVGCGSSCSAYVPEDEEELWVSGWRGGQKSATNHFDQDTFSKLPEEEKEREKKRKLVVADQQIIVKSGGDQIYFLGSLSSSLLATSPSPPYGHPPPSWIFHLPEVVVGGEGNEEKGESGKEREGVIIKSKKGGTIVDASCSSHSFFISYSFQRNSDNNITKQ